VAIGEGCKRSFLVDVWGSGKFGGNVFSSIFFFLNSAFLFRNASNRTRRASSIAQCQDESKY